MCLQSCRWLLELGRYLVSCSTVQLTRAAAWSLLAQRQRPAACGYSMPAHFDPEHAHFDPEYTLAVRPPAHLVDLVLALLLFRVVVAQLVLAHVQHPRAPQQRARRQLPVGFVGQADLAAVRRIARALSHEKEVAWARGEAGRGGARGSQAPLKGQGRSIHT